MASKTVFRGSAACLAVSALLALAGCSPNSAASGPSDGGMNPPGSDGGVVPTSGDLPCDVSQALTFCRGCHSSPPSYGAPMPLLTYADLVAPAVTDPSMKVYQVAETRINSTTSPMPPSPWGISDANKATLNQWFQAGAPPVPAGTGCSGSPSMTSNVGPDFLPCTPSYTFTAHDMNDPSQGFPVPTGGDLNYYECFAFTAPFAPGEQATAWAPIIDQKQFLHHWILWEAPPNTKPDGDVSLCNAIPTVNSKFLMGWAPGGQNTVLPSDVGLHLDPGATLMLQVHYYNALDVSGSRDKSGIAMCTTTTPRANEAGIMATGNLDISLPPHQVTPVTANCPGSYIQQGLMQNGVTDTSQIHVLGDGPHMHLIGTKFSTVINHSDGTTQTLVDVDPFDFNNQTGYPHDPPVTVDLAGGDNLTTVCTFDNEGNSTVTWGENTQDEMCFDFMMVYPFPVSPGYAGGLIGAGGMLICPAPNLATLPCGLVAPCP